MASRNIVIKNNTLCFKSALLQSSDFSFLFLYILADLISFLEIQGLQLAGSSSTVFAVNLILYYKAQTLGPHFSLSPSRVSPFSRGVIFTRARASLTLLSLRKNGERQSTTFTQSKITYISISRWPFGSIIQPRIIFMKGKALCSRIRTTQTLIITE